jgi:hypothetical protein
MFERSLRATAVSLSLAAMTLASAAPASAQPGPYGPPPGYNPSDAAADNGPDARAQDDQYSYQAEQWAAENCVAERANNEAAGAVIGGILGALIGSGAAGRYHRGAGAVVGGALGATAGAAIGASAGSNPNCPPGYVLRDGAQPFYADVYGPVPYAAPVGYDPWIWYGGHWIYRPYPYHRYWYRTHHRR